MDVKEMGSLGGKARAKKLGKEGLSEANTKAINERWARVSAEERKAWGQKLTEARKRKQEHGTVSQLNSTK